jgi:hypothetical protein
MRKLIIVVAIMAMAFTFGPMAAVAQTGITLNPNTGGTITFSSGGTSMSVGILGIDGTATGTGALAGTNGNYSITGGPVSLSLLTNLFGVAVYSASGTFSFDITKGLTTLLTGTLSLVDLVDVGKTGITNSNLVTNITITGGTLDKPGQPFASGLGIGQLTLMVGAFLPPTTTTSASLHSATIDPTPEPVSMLLFGTGLLAVGVFARRSRRGAQVP